MEINFENIKKFCKFYSRGRDLEGNSIENCFYNFGACCYSDNLKNCKKEACPLCEEKISRPAAISILEEEVENCNSYKELKKYDPKFEELLAAERLAINYLKRWDSLPREISSYILARGQYGKEFEWGDEIKYTPSQIEKILKDFCKEEKI